MLQGLFDRAYGYIVQYYLDAPKAHRRAHRGSEPRERYVNLLREVGEAEEKEEALTVAVPTLAPGSKPSQRARDGAGHRQE